jgi:octopine/nopaline transport system substrate-binding protein
MSRPRGRAAGLLLLLMAALASPGARADTPGLRIAVALDSGTAFAGFEAELAAALCARMAAACEFVPVGGDAGPLLDQTVDAVIAGMSVRPELRAMINFTRAYAEPAHGFVARVDGSLSDLPDNGKTISLATTPAEGAAAIAALRQAVAGRTIGAVPGSPDIAFLERNFGEVAKIVATTQPADDLVQGRLDLIMGALPALDISAEQLSASGLAIAGPRFRDDDSLGFGIAAGVRKSDRALRDRLDRAIADMIADGSLRQLSLAHLGADITPQQCACKPF